MSPRWLLSMLCLSFLFLLFVPLTRARGMLSVNEARTILRLQKETAEVLLATENLLGEALKARVRIDLLDPQDHVVASVEQSEAVDGGSQSLTLSLPFDISKLAEQDRKKLLWYRLHYRITSEALATETLADGIISLSEITPDIFEVRVATSLVAREGTSFRARAQVVHPITHRPAPDVRIDGELTLEDDDDKSVKLRAAGVTDSEGYVSMAFPIPARFPHFPHTLQPAGGSIHVVARQGVLIAETVGDVLVNQFPLILISSDKPIYQPGQVLHVRALSFTPSRHALADQNMLIRICDSEGTNVFRTIASGSRFGIATADWPIPENTRLGDYRIWVGIDGENEDSQRALDVRISRYELPNFSVKVQPDRKYYLPGQNAAVRIQSEYLFGQPVTHGHVRVVRETEREWNFREQKWETKEEEKQEGDTDANGVFLAQIELAGQHKELADENYSRFRDVSYTASFTDPTTNRTEQRHFDLRVTKQAIHVYVIRDNDEYHHNRKLPFTFNVSTFYADGSPALCKVGIGFATDKKGSGNPRAASASRLTTNLTTNRYGLGRFNGSINPAEFNDVRDSDLTLNAVDLNGMTGSTTESVSFDDENTVKVEADKTIYRSGEPVKAFVTSSVRDAVVMVDLAGESNIFHSERVQLHNGHGSVTFPFSPEFKGKLTIAAYSDFPESQRMVGTYSLIYPMDSELKLEVQTAQTSYRPGDDAQVGLQIRGTDGRTSEGVLGVVLFDKAVEERWRTDQEFGHRFDSSYDSLRHFLGNEEQLAGVSVRDLQHLDMSKPVAPDLDLLARVMLNQSGDYYPAFHEGDEYDSRLADVFGPSLKAELKPLQDALQARYLRTAEYPTDEQTLVRLLSESPIDFKSLRDPWGTPYRALFGVDKQSDVLTLRSAGPDKRLDTDDDFSGERLSWDYFRRVKESIDRAVRQYHQRTGGFIRNFGTLRDEVANDGIDLGSMRDRWGQAYRFDFDVSQGQYVVRVLSGGPDGRFDTVRNYTSDDFVICSSTIDYFAEPRARIDATLLKRFKSTGRFPRNFEKLRNALKGSDAELDSLLDPWNQPYYAVFKTRSRYSDRERIENHANPGAATTKRTEITPVTEKFAILSLRSIGADGKGGTADDFEVASFTVLLSEQSSVDFKPRKTVSGVVLAGTNGAIYGAVTDPMGAAIPGVSVTATRTTDSRSYESLTDDNGKYLFTDLSPGLYEIRSEARGFKSAITENILVQASDMAEVNVILEIGAATETVMVSSSVPAVQTKSASSNNLVEITPRAATLAQISTPRLREYFPETLVWQPSIETDKQGHAQVHFKFADNITTWKMSVIGSTEDGQVGSVERELRAFQPFFVEHDPPRVLTEGDVISLPVVLRNYLAKSQSVELEMKPESWFTLLGPSRQRAEVPAGDAARKTFDLRAIAAVKDGKQQVTATGATDSDAIEKPVTVRPDGEDLSATASDIIGDSSILKLNVPTEAIANSVKGELKIYPNLVAHMVESVEAIMARPYGCGEQTISSTYPSLMLLHHFKDGGGDIPIRRRAERYVQDGYSRLLNYQDEKGGFTYWGRGEPDVALTAYALRFLTDARDVVSVDEKVIQKAREWLLKKQRADGSWKADEYWTRAEDKRATVLLTAYIARVLAAAQENNEDVDVSENKSTGQSGSHATLALKHALDYLGQRVTELDEPYLIASYALAALDASDPSRAAPAVSKLRTLSHSEGDTTYWSLETNTPFYGWGTAGRVETTALVLQALARFDKTNDALVRSGLLFLLKHKDRYGVWYSTQSTVNVLDAMLAVLSQSSAGDGNSSAETSAEIFVNGRSVQKIKMPAASQLSGPRIVDLSQELKTGSNDIEIRRDSGSALASAQAVAGYYLPWSTSTAAQEESIRPNKSNSLRLMARFDKTSGKVNDEFVCHVEAERIGFSGYGMMLAEIGLPPGADVDRASLEKAMANSDWAISQYDVLPDRIVVYLWPRAGGIKFDFRFRPRFGLNAKTAPSVIYDYYNPEARATVIPATFTVK